MKNSDWDYRVPEGIEPTIPWSSKAPDPHSQHLSGAGGVETAEMRARMEKGVHPVLVTSRDLGGS